MANYTATALKQTYWYKIGGKTVTKAQYNAYENPVGDGPTKSTNDPDASGRIAKREVARSKNKASKRSTVLTKKQTELKDQGTKPPKKRPPFKKKDSPLNWGWKDTLDAAQTGLTGLGMIPAVGNLADGANALISGGRAAHAKYKGDTEAAKGYMKDMAINSAAMVPGAGLAVGGAKLAAKAVKGTKAANVANKVVKGAEKGEKVLKTVYKGNKTGKVKNTANTARNLADSVTSGKVIGKGHKNAYNVVSGKTAVKGSKVSSGVGHTGTVLAENKKKGNNKKSKLVAEKRVTPGQGVLRPKAKKNKVPGFKTGLESLTSKKVA